MAKATSAEERAEFERTQTDGTDLSWALRSLLWNYNNVQRHIAEQMEMGTRDVSALEHLAERPELGPADLASILGISTASATVLIDRLEDAGHVERRAHPSDRRRKQINVTEHATAEMFRTLQPLFDALTAIDDNYTPSEAATIASYLRAVTDAYETYTTPT
ncbi:MarR family winged helix-turn-helix transcriptional regulator [Ilumatobacter sp.]|uniref:MarR family winged helix-turn-helix transcriptional regulator n=1 Tax=Ilumatobacter sp. TaxID=1967498 RepID=UPI003B527445